MYQYENMLPVSHKFLTITGTNSYASVMASAYFVKTFDNKYRMIFNFKGTQSNANTLTLTVADVVFSSIADQACTVFPMGSAYANATGTNTIVCAFNANTTSASVSGDVLLESKPLCLEI